MLRPTAVVMVVAALAIPAVATGSHGGPGGTNRDFATGAGTNTIPVTGGSLRAGFAAHSDPFGNGVRGFFSGSGDLDGDAPADPGFKVKGPMTCLRVDGNRASFKYRFEGNSGSAEPLEGGGIQIFVEDNGNPDNGSPADAMAFDPPEPAGVFDLRAGACDDPNLRPYDPLDSGNVVVHDALP